MRNKKSLLGKKCETFTYAMHFPVKLPQFWISFACKKYLLIGPVSAATYIALLSKYQMNQKSNGVYSEYTWHCQGCQHHRLVAGKCYCTYHKPPHLSAGCCVVCYWNLMLHFCAKCTFLGGHGMSTEIETTCLQFHGNQKHLVLVIRMIIC